MKILCPEHYRKVVEYAASIGDDTLDKEIEKLKSWQTNSHRKCEIELRIDPFAPYSFLFRQRYDDNTYGISGGLIYHGDLDLSHSYQIVRKKGWQTHT